MANNHSNIPKTIGRYQIKQLLGRGGMASVYLAHDPHFERDVALKILPREFLHDPQFLSRFQREAKIIASLDHPAIVPVYDYGEDDGQPYLVMRYMAGGSLAEHLHLREISLSETLQIIKRIAAALDEAHQKGLVHRDLKPGNVLFDQRQEAFLSDFGIVKMTEGTSTFTTGGGVIGTPAYMSPEQVHGAADMDGRSDIYTLGVMLYQMITGEMPYKADTPVKQMMAHVLEPIPNIRQKRPDLPVGYGQVIQKALAKNKEERFSTATLMVNELETLTNAGVATPVNVSHTTGPSPAAATSPVPVLGHDDATATIAYDSDLPTQLGGTPGLSPPPVVARRFTWLWIGGGLIIGALALAAVFLLNNGPTIVETPTPTTNILIAQATSAATTTETTGLVIVEETATTTLEPTATAETTHAPELSPTALLQATATLSPVEALPTIDATPTPSIRGTVEIGRSAGDIPITAIRVGNGRKNIVLIGGMHAGFAPATVSLAVDMARELQNNPELVPDSASVYIVTNTNPDSPYDPGELRGRLNANEVDLNRNWDCNWAEDDTFRGTLVEGVGGEEPFSEPETAALSEWLLDLRPVAVVLWEARANNGLVSAGGCLAEPRVSAALAELYSERSGYALDDFERLIQQPIHGDAANWLDSQGIPTVSILLPDYLEKDVDNNREAVLAILELLGN